MARDVLTDAILLLNVAFVKGRADAFKPLTQGQYRQFAMWLKSNQYTPADLLGPDHREILDQWSAELESGSTRVRRASQEHIQSLLERGVEMGLALEKWQRAGLWVLTRASEHYPLRLKQRLKTYSPPVLFGCGDITNLVGPSVAVVGSRIANQEDLDFCREFGARMAQNQITVVSGAAKGVDQGAMNGALTAGGPVVGVLAEGVLHPSSSNDFRSYIADGQLTLVSPFHPEARWQTYQAMGRNKLIYCLADAGLVVASAQKSGTSAGAEESLKNNWIPLWVKRSHQATSWNAQLVGKGGYWLPETDWDFHNMVNPPDHELAQDQSNSRPTQ